MTRSTRLLVDTSAWVEYLREGGDPEAQRQVRGALDTERAVLCDMVLVELWNGRGGSRQRKILRVLEETLEILPTNEEVWTRARSLARDARAAGLTVPSTDLLVAACASVHDAGLIHRDAHFDRLSGLEGREEGREEE